MRPDDFDYSTALNVGIERVSGELVLILSAHAIPVDDALGGRHDRSVRGPARGGRREPPGPLGRRAVARGAAARPRSSATSAASLTSESGGEILFSNAASCMRRSVWLEQPFTLPAAEDLEWAERVVAAGLDGRLRAGRGRLPLPRREPARTGAAPDRRQPHRVGGTARARGAGRCARPPASSTATPARSLGLDEPAAPQAGAPGRADPHGLLLRGRLLALRHHRRAAPGAVLS